MSYRLEIGLALLLAAAVAIALWAANRRPTRESDFDRRTSTYLSGPTGSKALNEVLARLGRRADRRQTPYERNRQARITPEGRRGRRAAGDLQHAVAVRSRYGRDRAEQPSRDSAPALSWRRNDHARRRSRLVHEPGLARQRRSQRRTAAAHAASRASRPGGVG